jgi:hypothetical protein
VAAVPAALPNVEGALPEVAACYVCYGLAMAIPILPLKEMSIEEKLQTKPFGKVFPLIPLRLSHQIGTGTSYTFANPESNRVTQSSSTGRNPKTNIRGKLREVQA